MVVLPVVSLFVLLGVLLFVPSFVSLFVSFRQLRDHLAESLHMGHFSVCVQSRLGRPIAPPYMSLCIGEIHT